MANILSAAARAVVIACDLADAIEMSNKMFQNPQNNIENDLATAAAVNRFILLGFTLTQVAAVASGSRPETLKLLKGLELLPRAMNVPIQLAIEGDSSTNTGFKGTVRILEKGLLMPFADLIRVSGELEGYNQQGMIEQNKKDPTAKRPIYEQVGYGEDSYYEIVGYRPIDPIECQNDLNTASNIAGAAAFVRGAARVGVLEQAAEVAQPFYERLARYFTGQQIPVRPVNQDQNQGQLQQIEAEAVPDFQALQRIPLPLHEDAIFRRYICTITQEPARDPVRDPNGVTIYDRHAIVQWVQFRGTSPMTRNPMTVQDLQEMPAVQALINHRLREHQDALSLFIQGRLEVPTDARLEQAAAAEHQE